MMETPQLKHIEQVSDGWIKKYILTYTLPDGSDYVYESASRKGIEAYRAALAENAALSQAEAAKIEGAGAEAGVAAATAGEAACPAPQATADAVSIVPQTDDGQLVLIREFRYPLNSWCVALPAGLVEPGEPLTEAVDRELREETGYALRTDLGEAAVSLLPQAGYSSTGMTDETVQMVFAQVAKAEDAHPEPGELIEVFTLPIADVPRFLEENRLPMGTRLQLVLEIFARRH